MIFFAEFLSFGLIIETQRLPIAVNQRHGRYPVRKEIDQSWRTRGGLVLTPISADLLLQVTGLDSRHDARCSSLIRKTLSKSLAPFRTAFTYVPTKLRVDTAHLIPRRIAPFL